MKIFKQPKIEVKNRFGQLVTLEEANFIETVREHAKNERNISENLINEDSSMMVRSFLEDNGLTMGDFDNFLSRDVKDARVRDFIYNTGLEPVFTTIVESYVRGQYESVDELGDLVMSRVPMDQMTQAYYSAISEDGESYEMVIVAEGADIPVTKLVTDTKHIIVAEKKGRGLSLTDESVKSQRIDQLQAFFRKLGIRLQKSEVKQAISVLLNGYFGDIDAPQTIGVKSTTSYDLTDLWFAHRVMTDDYGFVPNEYIMNRKTATEYLGLKDGQGNFFFLQNILNASLPEGIQNATIRINEEITDDKILLVDKRNALQEYVFKDLSSETERSASKQASTVYTSKINQFVPFEKNARMILDLKKARS